jgi:hypothetical protein
MRYAANLMFQYGLDGHRQARPLCEKRIIVLEARGAKEAVRRARQYGKRQELSYRNADGQTFRIRFLGLVDVLGLEHSEAEEVYYSMFRTSRPVQHLQRDEHLAVFQVGPRTIKSAWWAVPAELAKPAQRRGGRHRQGV